MRKKLKILISKIFEGNFIKFYKFYFNYDEHFFFSYLANTML